MTDYKTHGVKRCTRCGAEKMLCDFGVDSRRKDGKKSACKSCCAKSTRLWAKNNPEKNKERKRRYAKTHQEKIRAKTLRWMERNKEKVAVRFALLRERPKEALLKKTQRWRLNNVAKVREMEKLGRDNLVDGYIAKALRLTVEKAPKALIDMKRQQLTLRRLARQLKKGLENEAISDRA